MTTKAQLVKLRMLRRQGVTQVPPVITSASSASVAENAQLSFALLANEAVTWALVGGPDVGDFEISGSTLRWLGNVTRDFEAPADADLNNVYGVTVQATSVATSLTAQLAMTITVTDVLEVGVPDLWPSVAWGATGLAGSGWTTQPAATADRLLTDRPRPWCRPLFAPKQTLDGDLVIGVDAGADGGLLGVRFDFEGRTVLVTDETKVDYVDVNGVASWFFGYCVRLKFTEWLALNAAGIANLYVTAIPNDAGLDPRTVGPFPMRARPTAKLYDVVLDWTPSLPDQAPVQDANGTWRGRYNTLEKALEFCHGSATRHHCLITATENLDYNCDVVLSPSRPAAAESWIVITAAPGVLATLHGANSGGSTNSIDWRSTNKICFRGAGVEFQPNGGNFNMGASFYAWWDGAHIESAPDQMFMDTLAVNPAYFMNAGFAYFTDCTAKGSGFSTAQLCRSTYTEDCAGDGMDHNKCIHNCDIVRNNHQPPRTNAGNEALRVSHPAGTATLECSGDPRLTSRTITIKNAGVTLSTFALNATLGGGNYTFTDVANWINGDATLQANGITASVISPIGLMKRALYMSSGEAGATNSTDLSPTQTLPATKLKAGGTVFTAIIDVHGDGVQYTLATYENLAIRFLRITDTIAAQQFFMEGAVFKDMGVRDCLFWSRNGEAGIDSDWGGDHSHVLVERNSFVNILVEWFVSGSTSPNFSCDTRVKWRENIIDHAVWILGTWPVDPNIVLDGNYFWTGTLPARATNSPTPTTPALSTIYVDPANRNYAPLAGGALKFGPGANDYYGCFLPSGELRALAA